MRVTLVVRHSSSASGRIVNIYSYTKGIHTYFRFPQWDLCHVWRPLHKQLQKTTPNPQEEKPTWTWVHSYFYTFWYSNPAKFNTKTTLKQWQWKNTSWSASISSQFVRSWLFTSALCHHMDWGVLQTLHTPELNFCTILHQINSKTPAMEELIMVYTYLISICEILGIHICPMSLHGLGCTASSTHSGTQFMHNFPSKQLQNTRNGRIHHGLHLSHLNSGDPGCSHLPHVLTWTGLHCKLYTLRHSISAQFAL